MTKVPSFAVIGAGIVGSATAYELTRRFENSAVTVFEKETAVGSHQTGHNSGVVHAGLYYEPGGLKARLCRRGVELLKAFCEAHDLPYDECGKVVVAQTQIEVERLQEIYRKAIANGVPDVALLDKEQLQEVEPGVQGLAAIHSPHTAVTDFAAITTELAAQVVAAGGELRLNTEVTALESTPRGVLVRTTTGSEEFDFAVVCGGLQSDRLAQASGLGADPAIVPFFGQYLNLDAEYHNAVNGLVYPVPDPAYPFLGVHITRRIDGGLMLGPNAFLSFAREGYRGLSINPRDSAAVLTNPAFWRFASKNMAGAMREIGGVLSMKKFVSEAAKFVPDLATATGQRATRGIRAQALSRDGSLVDDFVIQHQGASTFVRNAPSPGATSSMAIAEHIVQVATEQHGLKI